MKNQTQIGRSGTRRWWIVVLLSVVAIMIPSFATAANADAEVGDRVWIGAKQGYSGTGIFPVYLNTPADVDNPGEPDYWAYCIEHDVSPKTRIDGEVRDASDYLGDNFFSDSEVQGKVLWVLAHSFPAISLDELGAAANTPGLTLSDAAEATQYAIWRYTDLEFDADWYWETPASEAVYKYLIAGANSSPGLSQADLAVSVSIAGPATQQMAKTLVGPFVLNTDQPFASVSVDPALPLVDSAGIALDADAIVSGQEFFIDGRDISDSGAAIVTASVTGSSAFGHILSVPTQFGGTPTAENHAQSVILAASSSKSSTAQATVSWEAAISTVSAGGSAIQKQDGPNKIANTGSATQAPVFAAAAALLLAAGTVLILSRKIRPQK